MSSPLNRLRPTTTPPLAKLCLLPADHSRVSPSTSPRSTSFAINALSSPPRHQDGNKSCSMYALPRLTRSASKLKTPPPYYPFSPLLPVRTSLTKPPSPLIAGFNKPRSCPLHLRRRPRQIPLHPLGVRPRNRHAKVPIGLPHPHLLRLPSLR
jgi:hypothetical protein